MQCAWTPASNVQAAIQAASEEVEDDMHAIRFRPHTKVNGESGEFDGLGDIAEGLSLTMGYDVAAIYFMWYVGFWQFYLLDATWRSGVSAWKLLRQEVEKEEIGKGPEDLGAALKGEAVLALMAAEAKQQEQNASSGILSWLSGLLPHSPTCAELMLERYVRVFAGKAVGRPEDFVPEACGRVERRSPDLILATNTLELLDKFFGLARVHLEHQLKHCDLGASATTDLLEKVEACGLLKRDVMDFDGACCEHYVSPCGFDIVDDGTLGDALREIGTFRSQLCG